MRIGFDLDEIFITHPPFIPGWLIEKLYRGKTEEKLEYRIPGKLEQKVRAFSHLPLFRPPLKKNISLARNFVKRKGNTFFLISSRFGFLEKPTNEILKKYGLDTIFHETYFNFTNKQPHIFKDEIIRKLKIDRFIDDDLYSLEFLAKKNKNTTFFWLNKKMNKKISENLFAVTHLEKIAE